MCDHNRLIRVYCYVSFRNGLQEHSIICDSIVIIIECNGIWIPAEIGLKRSDKG